MLITKNIISWNKMLPEVNISFLENCLIQAITKEHKTLKELEEMTNFDRTFISYGINLLREAKIIEEGDYKIIRDSTETVSGLRAKTYQLTPLWQELYCTLDTETPSNE